MHAMLLQSCLTLCNPMDYSPPGSSVHGILQARILEWGAISFSRGSSWARDQTCISWVSYTGRQVLHHWCHLGSSYQPAAAAAKSLQVMSNSVWPHRRQPTRLPHPWDSPGKNTGVGCHFLLQCIKVKSESEVA